MDHTLAFVRKRVVRLKQTERNSLAVPEGFGFFR
jgi:hypothetical protein